jgi:hypothetical protein
MAKITKKIPVRSSFEDLSVRKKVIVFSMNQVIAQQMKRQLEKKNFFVCLVHNEKDLLPQINQADPQIILMDVVASAICPFPALVAEVFVWMRGRARAINKFLDTPSQYLWEHSKIILFKSDSEMTATGSLPAQLADTDELVYQCSLVGNVKYIGLYLSFSFIDKMRSLVENFDE